MESQKDEWINVDDRLPDHDGRYAVIYLYRSRFQRYFIADWLVIEGQWSSLMGDTTITYWLELPPFPEE